MILFIKHSVMDEPSAKRMCTRPAGRLASPEYQVMFVRNAYPIEVFETIVSRYATDLFLPIPKIMNLAAALYVDSYAESMMQNPSFEQMVTVDPEYQRIWIQL
jgi:hypothetical protein